MSKRACGLNQKCTLRIYLFFGIWNIGKLKRVSEINTAEETFRSVMHYYLTWLATEDEVIDFYKSKSDHFNPNGDDFEPDFMPKLTILNFVDGEHEMNGQVKMKEGTAFKNVTKMPISNPFPQGSEPGSISKWSWDLPFDAIGFDPRLGYWLRVQYEVDVTFAEELELEFFPFDVCLLFSLSVIH